MLADNTLEVPYQVGDYLTFSGIVGYVDGGNNLNGKTYAIDEVVSAGSRQYKVRDGYDYSAYSSYTSGGQAIRTFRNFFMTPIKYVTRAIMIPKTGSTYFPNILGSEFQQAITNGTLAELYKQPDRAWSDINLSNQHRMQFEDDMLKARSRAEQEHVRSSKQKVKYGGY